MSESGKWIEEAGLSDIYDNDAEIRVRNKRKLIQEFNNGKLYLWRIEKI